MLVLDVGRQASYRFYLCTKMLSLGRSTSSLAVTNTERVVYHSGSEENWSKKAS